MKGIININDIHKSGSENRPLTHAKMGVDPAALTRALNGNARLDTIQKIATALGVSVKSLFEPVDTVEGYIKIKGKIYQFNCREELLNLLD